MKYSKKYKFKLHFLFVFLFFFLIFFSYSTYNVIFLKKKIREPLLNSKFENISLKFYNSILKISPFYKKTNNHILYNNSLYPQKELYETIYRKYDKFFYSNLNETFKRYYVLQNILEIKFNTKFTKIIIPDKFTANENIEYEHYEKILKLAKQNKIKIFDLKKEIKNFKNKNNFQPYSKNGYHWSYGFLCSIFNEIYNFNTKKKYKFDITCNNKIIPYENWSDSDLLKPSESFFKKDKSISLWPANITKITFDEKIIVGGNSFSDQLIYFFQLIKEKRSSPNNLIYLDHTNNIKKISDRSRVPNDINEIEVTNTEKLNLLKNSDRLILLSYLSDYRHLKRLSLKNNYKNSYESDMFGLAKQIFLEVEYALNKNEIYFLNKWIVKKDSNCSSEELSMIITNFKNQITFKDARLVDKFVFDLNGDKKAKFYSFEKVNNSNPVCVQIN